MLGRLVGTVLLVDLQVNLRRTHVSHPMWLAAEGWRAGAEVLRGHSRSL